MTVLSKTLVVISGPTASGKTDIAIQLAQHYKTVIVSADSRQFYREMCIGTAKPTVEELTQAKHFFINSHSITENFTAGNYEKECLSLLTTLFTDHDRVIMVGGSGLFLKAVCEGLDEFPTINTETREMLNNKLKNDGLQSLQEKLKTADPEYYAQVDINNPQRVIRALEVFESRGKPFSAYRKSNPKERPFNVIKLGINLSREMLYQRINQRVDDMILKGLVEEVRSLLPYRHFNSLNTVGYSELFDYFDGKTGLQSAVELIKQNTRHYAKRQLTWFKKDKQITWKPAHLQELINYIDTVGVI